MKNKIAIAFVSNGGLANFLFHLNFVYAFRCKFPNKEFEVTFIGHEKPEVNWALLSNQEYIDYYLPREKFNRGDDYDVCIYLRFYPEIYHESAQTRKYRELHRQLESWDKFRNSTATRKFFETYPEYDFNIYTYSILNEKMCLDSMDHDNALGLGKEYAIDLSPDPERALQTLEVLGLKPGAYITIHAGRPPHSSVKGATRLWRPEAYEKLALLLQKEYPKLKIVQIGRLGNPPIKNVDLNLVGRQTFPEFASVLKHAAVHIGSDSGAVHLRKAIKGGPSVVLFGPTPSAFFGYMDNVNIQKTMCPHWCAGLTDIWRNQCLAGEMPACMEAITPEEIFEAAKGILGA